ncbi:hypothetical protein GGR53DRAFT_464462 [Hypoxylon sp. FL1150]|nr:hypothetical protein GGR53DRAFT_464462 [Hypoxylon sp. FL1150]
MSLSARSTYLLPIIFTPDTTQNHHNLANDVMVPAPSLLVADATATATFTTVAGGSTIASNVYEQALERLRPLQPVLWGFNHRNRNQHRRAAWWGAFGMLRRRVDKVVEELASLSSLINTSNSNTRSSSSRSSSSGVAKSKKRKRVEEEAKEQQEEVRGHVRWLRDVLVPRCYLAFSQLTADNQFATLGVVLLGALAQVNAACVGVTGNAPMGPDNDVSALGHVISTMSVEGRGDAGDAKKLHAPIRSDRAPGDEGLGQIGAVISRDEVARAEKLRRKKQKLEEGTGSRRLESPGVSNLTEDVHKRGGDDITSKAKGQDIKSVLGKEDSIPIKKKKKTRKDGDEFDNLFKGLF